MTPNINLILKQLDKIINSQSQPPENIKTLIQTKKQLLTNLKAIIQTETKGIQKIITYFQPKKYQNIITEFNKNLIIIQNYLQNQDNQKDQNIKDQIQFIEFEYNTLLKQNEQLTELLDIKLGKFPENELTKIIKKVFKDDTPKIKKVILSKEGIYLFNLLYQHCEGEYNFENIINRGFSRILYTSVIENLSEPQILTIFKLFIKLKLECQTDRIYEYILTYKFPEILRISIIKKLPYEQLLKTLQLFLNIKHKCQTDEIYKEILSIKLIEIIFENPTIQQMPYDQILEIMQDFFELFLNFNLKCKNEGIFINILCSSFTPNIFKIPLIKTLSYNQLHEIIQLLLNIQSYYKTDRPYIEILSYGFGNYGILTNPLIQEIPYNQLLEILQLLIKLRPNCQDDKIYINILKYGFTEGIFIILKQSNLEISKFINFFKNNINKKPFQIEIFTLKLYLLIQNPNLNPEQITLTNYNKEKLTLEILQKYKLKELFCITKINPNKFQNFFTKILQSKKLIRGNIKQTDSDGKVIYTKSDFIIKIYNKISFQNWQNTTNINFQKYDLWQTYLKTYNQNSYNPIEPILRYFDSIKANQILANLKHEKTPKPIDIKSIENNEYLIYTKILGINLIEFKKLFPTQYESLKEKIIQFKLIMEIILKNNQIDHNDVKNRNIIINLKTKYLYLIDFGQSTISHN